MSFEPTPNGDQQALYLLVIIAIAVLIIAWINYVNLATARATYRAKEVGIRKVVGAYRKQLVIQFLGRFWGDIGFWATHFRALSGFRIVFF